MVMIIIAKNSFFFNFFFISFIDELFLFLFLFLFF